MFNLVKSFSPILKVIDFLKTRNHATISVYGPSAWTIMKTEKDALGKETLVKYLGTSSDPKGKLIASYKDNIPVKGKLGCLILFFNVMKNELFYNDPELCRVCVEYGDTNVNFYKFANDWYEYGFDKNHAWNNEVNL